MWRRGWQGTQPSGFSKIIFVFLFLPQSILKRGLNPRINANYTNKVSIYPRGSGGSNRKPPSGLSTARGSTLRRVVQATPTALVRAVGGCLSARHSCSTRGRAPCGCRSPPCRTTDSPCGYRPCDPASS